jgi:hypothetical protein
MSWITPARAAIESLLYPDQFMSQSKEEALRTLRLMSEKDFGEDIKAWEEWAKGNGYWEFESDLKFGKSDQTGDTHGSRD